MTILDVVRDRLSGHSASADSPRPPSETPAGSAEQADPPFDGYDGLDDREVMKGLSGHSQIELKAVESYERSHGDRKTVLDKLRYMRGPEPLTGYDALSAEEIVTELKEADVTTIKKVRGYERKFANRPDILEEVVRLHHERLAAEPAKAPPGYQPMSAK